MRTTAAIEDPPTLPTQKRTRQNHHKVRTGCITCKIRRKKCDEEKPACRRCTSTGRKCDGYATHIETCIPEESSPSRRNSSVKRSKTTADKVAIPSITKSNHRPVNGKIYPLPSKLRFETDDEFYCFDFFRWRTRPEFAAYFNSAMWRDYMLRACFHHPAVAAAAAAVGAVHRRFELGISRQAFEYCDLSNRLYQKALEKWSAEMISNPQARQVNLLVMKLLSVFETFQGNYKTAEVYMANGLKGLFTRKMRTTFKDSQYREVDINCANLKRLFLRLELESVHFFGGLTTILSDPESSRHEPHVDPQSQDADHQSFTRNPNPFTIPSTFSSLCQARDVLFAEAKRIWHTCSLLHRGSLIGTGFRRHQTHISRLLQWSMAYAEYTKTETSRNKAQDLFLVQFLKAYREAAYLLLVAQMVLHSPDTGAMIVSQCDPPETCDCHRSCQTFVERKAALNAHFARLLVLCECLFNRSTFFDSEEHSMRVDSGIGMPLYLGATHCRSRRVRHQVTSLLQKSEIQSRFWETLGIYTIAETLSSVEEHAVMKCGAVRDELEPKWVDITFFLDENKMLLRYCHADQDGPVERCNGPGLWSGAEGLIWTQEWVSF